MRSSVAIIAIIVVLLCHKAPTEKVDRKQIRTPKEVNDLQRQTFNVRLKTRRHKQNLALATDSVYRMKQYFRRLQILNDIQIVLKNNADEYSQMEGQLKTFYGKVSLCRLDNCGHFIDLFPEKCFKRFQCRKMPSKCFKRFQCRKFPSKVLNNLTKKHLSRILCGAEIFVKMFQQLIDSEELLRFSRRDRVFLLKKFQTSMNTLINELNVTGHVTAYNWEQFPQVVQKSKNDLRLNEWRVIQMSLNATREYLIEVEDIQKCWAQNGIFYDF